MSLTRRNGANAVSEPLAAREGAVAAPAERGARKGGDAMNAHTLNTKARTYAVALVSIVLLAAAGPVVSAAGSYELQVACQSNSCGG